MPVSKLPKITFNSQNIDNEYAVYAPTNNPDKPLSRSKQIFFIGILSNTSAMVSWWKGIEWRQVQQNYLVIRDVYVEEERCMVIINLSTILCLSANWLIPGPDTPHFASTFYTTTREFAQNNDVYHHDSATQTRLAIPIITGNGEYSTLPVSLNQLAKIILQAPNKNHPLPVLEQQTFDQLHRDSGRDFRDTTRTHGTI